jgi:hypothetical protein
VAVAIQDADPGHLRELEAAGVTQLVLVASPPDGAADARTWTCELAGRWMIAERPRAGTRRG